MSQGIFTSLAAGVRTFEGLDMVANNLANATTPGFKAQRPVFRVVAPEEAANADPRAANMAESLLTLDAVGHDLTAGALQRTDDPANVALDGEGFFVVGDGRGALRYTRDGTLTVGADGELLHQSGQPLLGDGDQVIRLRAGAFEIDADGTVTQGGEVLGRLQVVTFDDPQALVREGSNLFAAGRATARRAEDVRVVQGALEQSNVEPLRELVTLIRLTRAQEAYGKVLKSLDETSGQLNSRVGRTNGG